MSYSYFVVKNINASDPLQVEWYRFDIAVADEDVAQTLTTITMHGTDVLTTSASQSLTETKVPEIIYDANANQLCAWKVQILKDKLVFLRFKKNSARWEIAHRRSNTGWALALSSAIGPIHAKLNVKTEPEDLATLAEHHKALLTEQLVVLQATVSTAAIVPVFEAAESLVGTKIFAAVAELSQALVDETQPLSLLTHLMQGADAISFSAAIVYLLQRNVEIETILQSGLLASFLQFNMSQIDTIHQAYDHLQVIARAAQEPLKSQLDTLLTQANDYGIRAAIGQSHFLENYSLNGQINAHLAHRVAANGLIPLTITATQANWDHLSVAFGDAFLRSMLTLKEDQWQTIAPFFITTIQLLQEQPLKNLLKELSNQPALQQRFIACIAPDVVQNWLQQNSSDRWLLLNAKPSLLATLSPTIIEQMVTTIKPDSDSTYAIWALSKKKGFEQYKKAIHQALRDFYLKQAGRPELQHDYLIIKDLTADIHELALWCNDRIQWATVALTVCIQQQACPLDVNGYKNIHDHYSQHLAQHRLLAKWSKETPNYLVDTTALQAKIVLSLLQENPTHFNLSTCLTVIFHDFDLRYSVVEQRAARAKVLVACFNQQDLTRSLIDELLLSLTDPMLLLTVLMTKGDNGQIILQQLGSHFPEIFTQLLAVLKIEEPGGLKAAELLSLMMIEDTNSNSLMFKFSWSQPEQFIQLLAALKIGESSGLEATELFVAGIIKYRSNYTLLQCIVTHKPEMFTKLLTYLIDTLKIGESSDLKATELFAALMTKDGHRQPLLQLIASSYPEMFTQLLAALKVGQPGGLEVAALFAALMSKDDWTLTLLQSVAFNTPKIFSQILVALKVGQAGGLEATVLLDVLMSRDIHNRRLLDQLALRQPALFKQVLSVVYDILEKDDMVDLFRKNILQLPVGQLQDDEKNRYVTRDELTSLLAEYETKRHTYWSKSFWKACGYVDSTTIQQLKALLIKFPTKDQFTLLEIRAKIHRKLLSKTDSGTDFVLQELLKIFRLGHDDTHQAKSVPALGMS